MNSLKFENKKFNSWLLWLMLMIIPVIIIGSLFTYQSMNPPNVRQTETQTANRLLGDLNWVLPRYRMTLNELSEDEIEANSELTQLNEIYTYLNEAEKARFNYSVAAWHEDWSALNESKQEIWAQLIAAKSAGANFTSLNADKLEEEKKHLDWLVDNEVSFLIPNQSKQSLFVLNKALDLLFSLPMIILIVLLYGLKIFQDFDSKQQNFTLVLPIKKRTVILNKLGLFYGMLLVFVGSVVIATLILSFLNQEINLAVQWSYPIITQNNHGITVFTLGELLIYRLIYFLIMIMLLLTILIFLNNYLRHSLVALIVLSSLCLIGIQLTSYNPNFYQFYNPFAWLDVPRWMQYATHFDLWYGFGIILCLMSVFIWLIDKHKLPSKHRTKKETQKTFSVQANFLVRFQLLKDRKEGLMLYSLLLVIVGSVMLLLNSYQTHQTNKAIVYQEIDEYVLYLESYKSELELKLEYSQLTGQEFTILTTIDEELLTYEGIQSSLSNEDYSKLSEIETAQLEADYLFLVNQTFAPGTSLPMRHAIFMPNAYLNYQLNQWKLEKDIQFVLPGGPYKTEYLPYYQESPQSGANEPPFAIDQAMFQLYLDERKIEHGTFSALNSLLDFLNHYVYLLVLVLGVLLFSHSYVKERDGYQTIRFLLVAPVTIKRILISKMTASLIASIRLILFAVVVVFIGGSLIESVGQLNFPIIEYVADSVGETHFGQLVSTIPLTRQSFIIQPLWRILVSGFALLISSVWLINQLHYLVSVFVKNRWTALLVMLLIMLSGALAAQYSNFSWLAYSPFSYLDIPKIISGEFAVRINHSAVHAITGVLSQVIAGFIFTLLALFFSRKGHRHDID